MSRAETEEKDGPLLPNRPDVPVSLYALAVVIAVEQAVLRWGLQAPLGVIVTLAAMGGLGTLVLVRRQLPGVGVMAVVFLGMVALVLASNCLEAMDRTEAVLERQPDSAMRFEVVSDSRKTETGNRARADVLLDGVRLGSVWLSGDERFVLGSSVRCVGRFSPNGDDEWGTANRAQGIVGTVRCVSVTEAAPPGGVRGFIAARRAAVLERIGPGQSDARAILAGSVCGSSDALKDSGLSECFSRCGTAHLVAVSGSHLAVMCGMVRALLEKTRLGPRARSALLLLAGAAFVAFCGAPVSALRAWVMMALGLSSVVAGRRQHSLSSVCAVALAMALADPAVSGQVAFQLSVLSVVGLCLFCAYAGYVLQVILPLPRMLTRGGRLASAMRRARDGAIDIVAASVTAQLVTAPVTCALFGELSLVAIPANLLLAQLVTLEVGLGMAACLLAEVPLVGGFVLSLTDVPGSVIAAMLRAGAGLPFASVTVEVNGALMWGSAILLSALLLLAWPKVNRKAAVGVLAAMGVVACAFMVRWRYFAPARVCVLDVGQGDAILVQDGASAVLVDAGPDDSVARELAELHVMHLDAVLITHLHDDHYGGVDDLAGKVPCDRVLVAAGVKDAMGDDLAKDCAALASDGVSEVALGDTAHVGGFALTVVWPTDEVDGADNEDSLELALTYDEDGRGMTGLLTGDAERDETGAVAASGMVGHIDFLKVGHHGSKVSLTAEECAFFSPSVAVASAGKGNSYGHPSAECVSMLVDGGATFLCTKDVGTVTLTPGVGKIGILTERVSPELADVA